MTNPLTDDREWFTAALQDVQGYTVAGDMPEVLNSSMILLEAPAYAPGTRFGHLTATYTVTVTLEAMTATAALIAAENAICAICAAIETHRAADLSEIGRLFNLADAQSVIYPAITLKFNSTIEME